MKTIKTFCLVVFFCALGFGQTMPADADPKVWAEALKIHRKAIVIDGALHENGMVSFKSALSPADVEAVRQYVIKRANEDKALERGAG